MPYKSNADLPKSVRDALPEHGQTIFRKAFNSAIKQYGAEDETRLMKVAWGAVKNVYVKKDDKWVLKEGKSAISDGIIPQPKEKSWIPVAKVGQAVRIKDAESEFGLKDDLEMPQTVYPTAEGFEKAVEMFKDIQETGYVGKNHAEILPGLEVLEQKFEYPFLYAKFNTEGEEAIKDPTSTGRSIDATVFNIEGHLLTEFFVPGVSVLFEPHNPACTREMGCASIIKSERSASSASKIDFDLVILNNRGEFVKVRDVNLYLDKTEMKDEELVKGQLLAEVAYLDYQTSCMFLKHDPALKIGDIVPSDVKPLYTIQIAISAKGEIEVDYHEGGGKKKMVEKGEEPVTFTEEQVKERIATAVSEVTERLDNAHAVVVTDLEKANETKIAELGTEHETAVKEAEKAAVKQAQARATFMQKFGLKDDSEVMKQYDEVKTVQDMQGLVNSMEIPLTVNAAAGISSASGGEENKVEKVEEVGNYDPIKGEWVPSYREAI